jgi:hypothetical protein
LDPSQDPKPSVHLLLEPVLGPKPFIFFGSATGLEAVRSFFFGSSPEPKPSVIFSGIRNRIRSRTAVWAAYRILAELTIPTLSHQVVSGFD